MKTLARFILIISTAFFTDGGRLIAAPWAQKLSDSAVRKEVLSSFEYMTKLTKLRLDQGNDDEVHRNQLLGLDEDYYEGVFMQNIWLAFAIVAKNQDLELLKRLLDVRIVEIVSANESIPSEVGDFYVKHPDLFEKALSTLPHEGKKIVFADMREGVDEVRNDPALKKAMLKRLQAVKQREGIQE